MTAVASPSDVDAVLSDLEMDLWATDAARRVLALESVADLDRLVEPAPALDALSAPAEPSGVQLRHGAAFSRPAQPQRAGRGNPREPCTDRGGVMTAPLLLPAGVEIAGCCWVLAYPNGEHAAPEESDAPHWVEERHAANNADHFTDERGKPVPTRLTEPCYLITALCGNVLDEHEEGMFCFADPSDAVLTAEAFGWKRAADGWMCSPDCDGCAEKVAFGAEECGPVLPPVPVLAGQDPLFGEAS